jgi:quinol monooxygenase YgiN
MIIVLGAVSVRPGQVDEALRLSQEHVDRSRAEPGCVAHAVHRDTENPQRLVFVEQWADQAALATHFKVPGSLDFVKRLRALATEAPSMKLYDARELRIPA